MRGFCHWRVQRGVDVRKLTPKAERLFLQLELMTSMLQWRNLTFAPRPILKIQCQLSIERLIIILRLTLFNSANQWGMNQKLSQRGRREYKERTPFVLKLKTTEQSIRQRGERQRERWTSKSMCVLTESREKGEREREMSLIIYGAPTLICPMI